jgi:hypothetical protein
MKIHKNKTNKIGVCPAWHKADGEKVWIFTDEICVE